MIDLLKKLLEQGLPTMLLVLGALTLAFGFFDFTFGTPFKAVYKSQIPLISISIVLLATAIGLWLLDRKKQLAAEKYLDGHDNLIRFLLCFVEAQEHCLPKRFSTVLLENTPRSPATDSAARYAARYLSLLGFLTPNLTSSEYVASEKADTLFRNNEFRARNAHAFAKKHL